MIECTFLNIEAITTTRSLQRCVTGKKIVLIIHSNFEKVVFLKSFHRRYARNLSLLEMVIMLCINEWTKEAYYGFSAVIACCDLSMNIFVFTFYFYITNSVLITDGSSGIKINRNVFTANRKTEHGQGDLER